MIRIGRKTFVKDSVITCNGYEIFLSCSCWTVSKNGKVINTGRLHTLEHMIEWCMENGDKNDL